MLGKENGGQALLPLALSSNLLPGRRQNRLADEEQ